MPGLEGHGIKKPCVGCGESHNGAHGTLCCNCYAIAEEPPVSSDLHTSWSPPPRVIKRVMLSSGDENVTFLDPSTGQWGTRSEEERRVVICFWSEGQVTWTTNDPQMDKEKGISPPK